MKTKNFLKKFAAIFFSASIFFTPLQALAQTLPANFGNEDALADAAGESAEKFYASLPLKKSYKSRQRPILIQGAMNVETEILARALKNPVAYRDLNYLYIAGTYKNYPVVICRTEQGMANAAASTALAIKFFNPIAVINQGTAGGHAPNLRVGDLVIGARSINVGAIKTAYQPKGAGTDITQQEMRGTYAFDETTGNFQPHKEYFADSTLLKIAENIGGFNAVTGTISSADSWLNGVDQSLFLHEKYGSTCEEMETAAVAQICKNAGLPWLGVRVISDSVTNTDGEYNPAVSAVAQNFVLRVVENYIRDVLKI